MDAATPNVILRDAAIRLLLEWPLYWGDMIDCLTEGRDQDEADACWVLCSLTILGLMQRDREGAEWSLTPDGHRLARALGLVTQQGDCECRSTHFSTGPLGAIWYGGAVFGARGEGYCDDCGSRLLPDGTALFSPHNVKEVEPCPATG